MSGVSYNYTCTLFTLKIVPKEVRFLNKNHVLLPKEGLSSRFSFSNNGGVRIRDGSVGCIANQEHDCWLLARLFPKSR